MGEEWEGGRMSPFPHFLSRVVCVCVHVCARARVFDPVHACMCVRTRTQVKERVYSVSPSGKVCAGEMASRQV